MQKKDLLPVLKEAKKYAVKKDKWGDSNTPILTTSKFVSKNRRLTIETTNLEKYFVCTIDTDIPNMTVFPDIKLFCGIIGTMDNEDIQFSLSDFTKKYEVEHIDLGKKINSYGYEENNIIYKPIVEKEKYPSLVISQNNSRFMIYSDGKNHFNLDEFPTPENFSEDIFTSKKIVIGKNKTDATIYHYIQDDWQKEENARKAKKKETNKLFPKYLKINGLVAKKGMLQENYNFNKGNSIYKYYCDYQISHDGNNTEQRIFVDEIQNYEAIDMNKKRK